MNHRTKPFTYEEYRRLLRLAGQTYRFVFYDDAAFENTEEQIIFWRHDIDLSVEQALRLAQIECEEMVQSTFFVHLHSTFYHPWEKETAKTLRQVAGMGHRIGLHFDCSYYGTSEIFYLESYLDEEASFLERLVGQPIDVCSLHNPTDEMLSEWTMERVGGMVNTYSSYFRNQVDYVSDSNGIWRYRTLHVVLEQHEHPQLQVLTHPIWWTDGVMSPEKKVLAAISRRAEATERAHRGEARVVIAEEPETELR